MPFASDGSLTTDSREVAVDATWDSQTDWEAYQSAEGVEIVNGAVQLAEVIIASRPDDNAMHTANVRRGLRIESTASWSEMDVELSTNTSGVEIAEIWRVNDGTLIAQKDITGLSGGDVFTIQASIQPGVEYNLVVWSDGFGHTYGYYDSPTFPYTSDGGDLSITAGAQDMDQSTASTVYAFKRIGNFQ